MSASGKKIPAVSRTVCLFFGVLGMFLVPVLYFANERATEKVEPIYIVLVAVGFVLFLAAGIVGRYPAEWDEPGNCR